MIEAASFERSKLALGKETIWSLGGALKSLKL